MKPWEQSYPRLLGVLCLATEPQAESITRHAALVQGKRTMMIDERDRFAREARLREARLVVALLKLADKWDNRALYDHRKSKHARELRDTLRAALAAEASAQ